MTGQQLIEKLLQLPLDKQINVLMFPKNETPYYDEKLDQVII